METGILESYGISPTQPASAASVGAQVGPPGFADAVLFDGRRTVRLDRLALNAPQQGDVAVEILWSGISTGTERLIWSGDMPPFPGLSYPLVPGYEAVGRIIYSPEAPSRLGEVVFVPGARCFRDAGGIFGGAASHLIVAGSRAHPLHLEDPREGVLLALAATAYHAVAGSNLPELIIGHGVLGRLAARLVIALGGAPVVWETSSARRDASDYSVIAPEEDTRRNYMSVCDLSGDALIIDKVLPHCARGAEIVLAGFYSERPSFAFPAAFMKEMRLRIAAEWQPEDVVAVGELIASQRLSLRGLITHQFTAGDAGEAYRVAFSDPACLKMIIDWDGFNG